MTDVLCGKLIQASDFPATVAMNDDTDFNNQSVTTFTKGTPAVEVTFVAPNSGQVLIYVGGTASNNGWNGTTNTDYIILSLELRVGSSSGTIVESPATQGYYTCRWEGPCKGNTTRQRVGTKNGLTPGQTYYASLQYRTANGSSTADLINRTLIVRPVP